VLTLNDIPAPCRLKAHNAPHLPNAEFIRPAVGTLHEFHYVGPDVEGVNGGGWGAPHLWEEAVEV